VSPALYSPRLQTLTTPPENLHSFVDEVAQLNAAALDVFVKRARGLYDENMKAYIKMMLRRGFSRLMVRNGRALLVLARR
jgi:hypothetical protein